MNREQRKKLQRVRGRRVEVPIGDIDGAQPRNPGVELKDREGVWVHSFICNLCGLHFNLYSWVPERHRTASIFCPECGQHDGKFMHYRVQTNECPTFLPEHRGEIFWMCPVPPGTSVMDDTTLDGRIKLPSERFA